MNSYQLYYVPSFLYPQALYHYCSYCILQIIDQLQYLLPQKYSQGECQVFCHQHSGRYFCEDNKRNQSKRPTMWKNCRELQHQIRYFQATLKSKPVLIHSVVSGSQVCGARSAEEHASGYIYRCTWTLRPKAARPRKRTIKLELLEVLTAELHQPSHTLFSLLASAGGSRDVLPTALEGVSALGPVRKGREVKRSEVK